jgi:hypothetical protein
MHDTGLLIDRRDPVGLFGHVDADENRHPLLPLSGLPPSRPSGHAVIALHSHRGYRAIQRSNRNGSAGGPAARAIEDTKNDSHTHTTGVLPISHKDHEHASHG